MQWRRAALSDGERARVSDVSDFMFRDRNMKGLLWVAVLLATSRGAFAAPWTVVFGSCTFSGNYDGAPLARTGSCPTHGHALALNALAALPLNSRGITSVPSDAFQGMSLMT